MAQGEGRTNRSVTAARTAYATSWTHSGRPTPATPAVTSAATLSMPRAAVRVKISATARAAATISQISQGSMSRLFSPGVEGLSGAGGTRGKPAPLPPLYAAAVRLPRPVHRAFPPYMSGTPSIG